MKNEKIVTDKTGIVGYLILILAAWLLFMITIIYSCNDCNLGLEYTINEIYRVSAIWFSISLITLCLGLIFKKSETSIYDNSEMD